MLASAKLDNNVMNLKRY